ncbi:MAG TPA: aspartate 1-decarboxylase [bacterium]|nr:aspartate 1-decarboxylase [bacterium]
MFRELMRAKIHRATVTEANLAYVGSLSVDEALLAAADIQPYEKISVVNVNTGARFETYAIPAPEGSGTIALNGGAARLGQAGDLLIVIAYGYYQDAEEHRAQVVFVDEQNHIVRVETQSRDSALASEPMSFAEALAGLAGAVNSPTEA